METFAHGVSATGMNTDLSAFVTMRKYTRDEMLKVKETAEANVRPDFLPVEFNDDKGLFAPDKWFDHTWAHETHKAAVSGRKKVLTRTEDELGLSPQRRQFAGGCVPGSTNQKDDKPKNWRNGKGNAENAVPAKADDRANRWRSKNESRNNKNQDDALPEWVESKISINDVIELKGFDGTKNSAPPITMKKPLGVAPAKLDEAQLLSEIEKPGLSSEKESQSTSGSRFINFFKRNQESQRQQSPSSQQQVSPPQPTEEQLKHKSASFMASLFGGGHDWPEMPATSCLASDIENRMKVVDCGKADDLLPELADSIRNPPAVHTKSKNSEDIPKWLEQEIMSLTQSAFDNGSHSVNTDSIFPVLSSNQLGMLPNKQSNASDVMKVNKNIKTPWDLKNTDKQSRSPDHSLDPFTMSGLRERVMSPVASPSPTLHGTSPLVHIPTAGGDRATSFKDGKALLDCFNSAGSSVASPQSASRRFNGQGNPSNSRKGSPVFFNSEQNGASGPPFVPNQRMPMMSPFPPFPYPFMPPMMPFMPPPAGMPIPPPPHGPIPTSTPGGLPSGFSGNLPTAVLLRLGANANDMRQSPDPTATSNRTENVQNPPRSQEGVSNRRGSADNSGARRPSGPADHPDPAMMMMMMAHHQMMMNGAPMPVPFMQRMQVPPMHNVPGMRPPFMGGSGYSPFPNNPDMTPHGVFRGPSPGGSTRMPESSEEGRKSADRPSIPESILRSLPNTARPLTVADLERNLLSKN